MTAFVRALACSLALLAACRGERGEGARAQAGASSTALMDAADEAPLATSAAHRTGSAEKAGERVAIPAGKFFAGSTPGDPGRDPTLEAASLEVELGAFEIDKLPHPNDPKKPPIFGADRDQASELCVAAGGRLCTELEWERACKGVEGEAYAGAAAFAPGCAKNPETCASGFGVLAMGGAMREWTASDVAPIKGFRTHAAAAVRGARADAADVDHRCAHRVTVDADSSAPDLGFRCCYGARDAATIPSPELGAPFQETSFPPDRLAALFASNPKLEAFASEVKYFRKEAAIATVRKRGESRAPDAAAPAPADVLTTSPLLWNPVPGEELLVVAGQSAGDRAFVVVFHRLSGERLRVAAAFLMEAEQGPIVLSYNPNVRKKLGWAICWECSGEAGNISYRNENRVAITQK